MVVAIKTSILEALRRSPRFVQCSHNECTTSRHFTDVAEDGTWNELEHKKQQEQGFEGMLSSNGGYCSQTRPDSSNILCSCRKNAFFMMQLYWVQVI